MVILCLFHQNSYFLFLHQNRPQAEAPKTCPPLVETQPRTGHVAIFYLFLRQNRSQAESPKTCPPLVETQPRTGHVGILHISCTTRNSAQFLPFWFIELHFFPALFQHKDVQKKANNFRLLTWWILSPLDNLHGSSWKFNQCKTKTNILDVGTLLFFSSRVQWNRAKAQYWALPSSIH